MRMRSIRRPRLHIIVCFVKSLPSTHSIWLTFIQCPTFHLLIVPFRSFFISISQLSQFSSCHMRDRSHRHSVSMWIFSCFSQSMFACVVISELTFSFLMYASTDKCTLQRNKRTFKVIWFLYSFIYGVMSWCEIVWAYEWNGENMKTTDVWWAENVERTEWNVYMFLMCERRPDRLKEIPLVC